MARTPRARRGRLSPFILLRRNGLYKGLLGGDRTWLVIGALVWLPRLAKRAFGRNEEVVAVETLRPGQVLTLLTLPQDTKAQRRAFRRTS